jgi:hypothetical protein
MAKMAKIAGMSYSEMLGAVLRAAEDRFAVQAAVHKIIDVPRPASIQAVVQSSATQ